MEAVRDLNLEIKDGELLAILGPSGCGKTSTLRMIVGLEEITEGEIYIGDRLVNYMEPSERNVAMAFETYALYSHLTVRENLAFNLRARRTPQPEIDARVSRVAKMLRLEDVLDKKPLELSGGHQQRVSLGRALIRQPSVFLLDEPLSHLDAKLRSSLREEIKRLHYETGTTMIYVTHDQQEALALADRIAVMNFAELQQVGTRDELYNAPANLFVAGFVGEPPINLMECEVVGKQNELHLVAPSGHPEFVPDEKVAAHIMKEGLHRVMVGIRPQNLSLLRASEDVRELSGRVSVHEFLGEDGHILLEEDGLKISALVPPDVDIEEGQNIVLYYDPSVVHVFDLTTGMAL